MNGMRGFEQFLFGVPVRLALRGGRPGLAPAGHLPFCFAKKVSQKGDPSPQPPAGVPEKLAPQAGSAETRLRLKHLRFLIRLRRWFFGCVQGI